MNNEPLTAFAFGLRTNHHRYFGFRFSRCPTTATTIKDIGEVISYRILYGNVLQTLR
jgi:hypothetical protein